MNCLNWNITVHENSKENKATQQSWGSKKKKKKGGGKESTDEWVMRPLYLAFPTT